GWSVCVCFSRLARARGIQLESCARAPEPAPRPRPAPVFLSSRRRHTRSVSAFLLNRSSDLAFLGTINPDTNKIPKHLFQGYLNIYNNYFKAPWMPDRTEANPNELNQDDARYGFRCCHLKNIWTAPLPPETELSRQMT